MAQKLGDIFWDLQPVVVYTPGVEMYARVLVHNPTQADRQYMLMVRLVRDTTPISEGALKVNGGAWFSVMAGDVATIEGMMAAEYTDVYMSMDLYERESGAVVDSVTSMLISPSAAGVSITLPTPEAPATGPDLMGQLMPLFMLLLMGSMVGGMAGGGAG